jgi:Kef-type K+ transport system membrane component KefB
MLVGVSVLDDLPAIALLSLSVAVGGRVAGSSPFAALAALPLGVLLALLSYGAVELWRRRRPERPRDPLSILLLLIASAWVGEMCGLTSLLGALWGGVLLARLEPAGPEVRSVLAVLSEVFLPLYFLSVGMRVQAASLLRPEAWSLALALLALAVVSKLACGLGVSRRDRAAGIDRWIVVFGLMPRGLPGLVFATTALSAGVIGSSQFSALVLMVASTTVIGLLLLERRLQRLEGDQPAPAPPPM